MAYVVLFTLATILISFLTGALAITKFNIKLKYVSFALPLGLLLFFSALQVGYMFVSLLIKSVWVFLPGTPLLEFLRRYQPNMFYGVTIVVVLVILVFACIYKTEIKSVIKNQFVNKSKIILFLVLFAILTLVFMNTKINFRFDDMNFYGPYINQRIFSVYDYPERFYDYQGLYTYLSVLVNTVKYLPSLGRFSNSVQLGYIEWIPAILTMLSMSFILSDFVDFLKEKISSKYVLWFVWWSTVILVCIDYWYTVFPHFGGTLRRISIIYILYFIVKQLDNKYDYKYLIMLLFGSYIFFSSSAFFLSAFLIYAYILYSMRNNRTGYIKEAAVFYIIPATYLIAYILYLNLGVTLNTILISSIVILYFLILVLKTKKLELFLNKFHIVFLIGIPLVIVAISFTFSNQLESAMMAGMGTRRFSEPINFFDMVPDIVNFEYGFKPSVVIFNVAFWVLVIVLIVRTWKKNNFYSYLILITVVTFFNPIAYKLVCVALTSAAYFRITDLFYNIVVIGGLLIALFEDENIRAKRFGIVLIIIMLVARLSNIEILNYASKDDFNRQYRVSQADLTTVQLFNDNLIQYSEKEVNKVASHIYGIQLLSKYDNVVNLLGDRFSYMYVDYDEFERTFARRYPGYELPDANYEKACTLAFERELDYVILDAQYNWMLQDGLWACSAVVLESDVYRVLKMDYDYWQSNIDLGYVEDYR